jgi:hypothetical protein
VEIGRVLTPTIMLPGCFRKGQGRASPDRQFIPFDSYPLRLGLAFHAFRRIFTPTSFCCHKIKLCWPCQETE